MISTWKNMKNRVEGLGLWLDHQHHNAATFLMLHIYLNNVIWAQIQVLLWLWFSMSKLHVPHHTFFFSWIINAQSWSFIHGSLCQLQKHTSTLGHHKNDIVDSIGSPIQAKFNMPHTPSSLDGTYCPSKPRDYKYIIDCTFFHILN